MQELHVTDAESKIMEALWAHAPLPFRDIVRHVRRIEDWHPKTIQTLIGRLVEKGMVQREPEGRGYLYRPAFTREEFVRSKSRSFVERILSGRVTPLVAAFTETRSLGTDDLKALRALVDSLEEGSRKGESNND